MRLIETYSNYCGVKSKKPFIDECYFSIPFDKYIVIHNGTGMATKSYDYFDEVFSHLSLPIIQVGGKDDALLSNVHDYRGKTSWRQTAFIIKHASLFVGGDSICAHLAASFAIPSVVLWGGTLPNTCSTQWNQDKVIHINPLDRYGCATACHSSQCIRPKKCINSILPEIVIEKIETLIGKSDTSKFKTFHTGDLAKNQMVEWVPINISQSLFSLFSQFGGSLTVRLDYHDADIHQVSSFCSNFNLKYVIIGSPAQVENISLQYDKVDQLMIMVDEKNILHGIEVLKNLTRKMYKTRLLSRLDHPVFNPYKLDILDYPPIARLIDFNYDDSHVEKFVGKEFNIKSARKIIGKDGRIFLSYNDTLKDQNYIEFSQNNRNITMQAEHLKELQFFIIRKYGN